MERNTTLPSAALRKLKDSDLTVAKRDDDVRGRRLVDRDGEELGKVDALFVDEAEKKVRLLRAKSGGFLGIGREHVLVPVEAVTGIGPDEVRVDLTRERLAGAPEYRPELIERPDYYASVYGYYGYTPFWASGYTYPMFPYLPPPPPRRGVA